MKEGNKSIDIIISKLDSNSLDLRLDGIRQLSEIDSPEVVEHFIRLLRDTSSEIQIRSAEALIRYKDRRSVPQLIETLDDGNKEVRKRVIFVLGEIRDKSAVMPLLKMLSDPRGEIRREAITALGKLGDGRAVEPLIDVLEDENRYVRKSAVEVLGKLGDERALEPIISRLSDNSADVKFQALRTLGELEDSRSLDNVLKLFKDPNPDIRKAAVDVARIIGDDRAIESFLALLTDPVLEVRLETVNALSDINDQRSIDNLVSLLDDTNWKIRVRAVESLKKLGVYDIIEKIIEKCIKDKNPEVRKIFLEFLENSCDERFIDDISCLIEDENWEVRLGLVRYYRSLGSERVIEYLVRFLKDPNNDVRITSIRALGDISSEKCADSLMSVLEDTDESFVKISVIDAINNIGHIEYIEKLKFLMKDEDPLVRERTAQILKKNNLLNYEHFIEAARGYFRDGKYIDTLDCIKKIEEYDENNPELLRIKGISLFRLDRTDEAVEILCYLEQTGNADSEIFEILGNMELDKNNTSKAIEYFEKADAGSKNNTDFLKKIAFSYEKNRDMKKAYSYYHKIFLEEPEDLEANIFLFRYFSGINPETSLDYFERVLKTGHVDRKLYVEAAWIAWKNGWAEKSMKICRQLEEKGLFDQTVSYIYSMFFLRNNMLEEAVLYIEKIDMKALIEQNQDMFSEFFNSLIHSNISAKTKDIIRKNSDIIEISRLMEYLEQLLEICNYSEWYEIFREVREKSQFCEKLDLFILRIFIQRKDYSLFEKKVAEFEECYGKDNASVLSVKGDYFYSIGKYENALENYGKIKTLLSISQRDNYARSLEYTGNFEKSVREIELLIQNTGESEYEYRLAELYISTDRIEKASETVRTLMMKYPENPFSYSLLGKIYYRKKDYSEALSCFKRAIDIDRKNTDSMHGLARIYIDKGVFEEAWILLNEIRSLTGEDRDFFHTLVHYYEKQGKWEDILKTLNRFEDLENESNVRFLKIAALFETKAEKEAYSLLSGINSQNLNPENVFRLAVYLFERGYTEKAGEFFDILLKEDDVRAEVLYYYSMTNYDYAEKNLLTFIMQPQYREKVELLSCAYINALIERGKYEEAEIRLEELMLKYPANHEISYLSGRLSYLREEFDKAVTKLEKAVMLNSDDVRPYYLLSGIFRKKGNYNKALSYMKTLQNKLRFELTPEYALEIADLYSLSGKFTQALEVMKKVSDTRPGNPDIEYMKGLMFYKTHEYKECSEIFEKLNTEYPDNPDYLSQTGKSYMKTGNFPKAVSALRRACELRDDINTRRDLAVSLHRAGMYEQAFEIFESLRSEESLYSDTTFYYFFAQNLFRKKDFNNALVIVNRLINDGKRNNDLLLLGARIYSNKDNTDKAVGLYEMMEDHIFTRPELIIEYSDTLERNGNSDKSVFVLEKGSILKNSGIYERLASAYMKRGMYDEALDNIELVLSEYPEDSTALNMKGTILEKQEKYRNSIEAYEKANNYFKLGSIYTKMHDYEKALNYFNKILDQDKDDFEANCFRAIIFKETGEYRKAIDILTSLERRFPEKKDSLSILGAIYELIDDIDKAEEYYLKMIESDINVSEAHFKLGNLLRKHGRNEKALEHFRKVLEIDPENAGATAEMASLSREVGNIREAQKLYSSLIEKIPDYMEAYIELAKIYIETGKYSESILLLKNQSDNDNPEINYLLAKTYFLAGDNSSANNAVRKAISRNNRFTDAYLLLSDISLKDGKIEDSEFSLKKALDINPLDRKVYLSLIRILSERERFDEAENIIGDYSKKFNHCENDEDYIRACAYFYKKKGDIEKASEYLSSIEKADDPEFLFEYGENLFMSDKKDEALNIFRQYIKKNMKDEKALHYMSEIYFEKEKYESIINLLEFSSKEMELSWKLLLDLGKAQFFKRDYDNSAENLRKSISSNPNNPEAYYYAGKNFSIRKKFLESISYLEKSVLMRPDNSDAQFELAKAYRNTKRYNDAVHKLQQLLNNSEIRDEVRKELGFIYMEMKMNEKAYECFAQYHENGFSDNDVIYAMSTILREKDPVRSLALLKELDIDPVNNREKFYEICDLLIRNEEYDEAESKLKMLLEDDIDDYRANLMLGNLYMRQELNADAIICFEKTVSVNPACFQAYLNLAHLVGDDKAKLGYMEKYRSYEPDNEDAEFFYMELLEKNRKEDEAYRIAEKFIDSDIEDISRLVSLSKVFFNSGDMENAEKSIRKAKDMGLTPGIMSIMADILFEKGDYDGALESYRELLEEKDQDVCLLNKRIADCCLKLDNIQESIKYYKKALQMNPEFWDAYTGLARCYEIEGLYEEALAIIENILTYYPNREDILFRAAEISEKSGRLIESSAYLRKLTRINPDSNEANYRLANISFKQENYKSGIEILGSLLGKRLTSEFEKKVRILFSDIFIKLENFEGARKELEKVLEFEPDNIDILKRLALCYEKNVKFDESLRIYQEIVIKDKSQWDVYLSAGDIYFRKGYLDKALAYYREAMKFNNSSADIYAKIAQVYEDKQILDKAISYYREAIRIDPAWERPYHELAGIYVRQGMSSEAIELYEKLIRNNPDCAEGLFRLSRIYSRKKEYSKALEVLERLVELEKNNPQYHLELAKVYHVLGKTDEAISESIRVVNIASIDSAEAREAQEMLKPDGVSGYSF